MLAGMYVLSRDEATASRRSLEMMKTSYVAYDDQPPDSGLLKAVDVWYDL